MKIDFRYVFLCIILACVSFLTGVQLQKHQAFIPLKRLLRGQSPLIAPPHPELLNWDQAQNQKAQPQFVLSGLPLPEIENNRRSYQEKIQELLGMSRFPLWYRPAAEALGREDAGGVIREKWLLETEPGLKIPFYLSIPKDLKEKRPLVLVLYGHSSGKEETAGSLDTYQHRNAWALARAGFVTAAPDFRGFGELGWQGNWEDPQGHTYGKNIHVQDGISNLQRGRTVLGSYLYDLQQLTSYLKTRQEIDPQRIGVAGTSMGADIALWFVVLHPAIKAAVASHSTLISEPSLLDYTIPAHLCVHTIPGILDFFRLQDIPLLAAPRPMLLTFNLDAQSEVNRKNLEGLYQQSGNGDKISFVVRHGGENFDNAAAVEWFRKWL